MICINIVRSEIELFSQKSKNNTISKMHRRQKLYTVD